MMTKVNLIYRSMGKRRIWWTTIVASLLVGGFFTTFSAAQRSGRASDSDKQQQQKEKFIKARLYYSNVEPKQLFDILQKTYHIQFEGTDTVTGPLTLISPGEDMADLQEMLALLDEVLLGQGKKTSREDKLIRIVPRSATQNEFIELATLNSTEIDKVVSVLKKRFMPETTEEEIVTATDIVAHPTQNGILVTGPEEVFRLIKEYLEKTSIAPVSAGTGARLPPTREPPLMREFISLEFMDPQEFQKLLETDETLKGKFTSAVNPYSLAIYSRDTEVFDKARQMKEIFDVDRMEIRFFELRYAQPHTIPGDPKKKIPEIVGLADLIQKIYPKKAPESKLPAQLERARQELDGQEESVQESPSELVRQELSRAGIIEPDLTDRMSRAISVVGTENDELVIVPYPERSGLLVRTFSRNIPKIQALIDVLDQPRDQVYIEVYITEVSHDDLTDLGVDWTLLHNEQTNTLQQYIPATSSRLPGGAYPSVLTYELISNNFTAFLRALEQTGKVDVISRPSVTTKDNSVAIFELGDKVPTLTSVRFSAEGLSSTTTVNYEDITNRLEVRPHIHPDDYVTLDILQKLDEISARTVQISKDFAPQIFITRMAKSTVRIKDGQTVCLGGFVSDKIVENETQVPLLGDIPILGELFKYSKRQRVKTELIIFITPHILRTPAELLRMTNEQRRKSVLDPRERRGDIIEPERTLRYPPFREPVKDPNLPDDGMVVPAPKPEGDSQIKRQVETENRSENPLDRLQSVTTDKTRRPGKGDESDKINPNAAADKTQDKIKIKNNH